MTNIIETLDHYAEKMAPVMIRVIVLKSQEKSWERTAASMGYRDDFVEGGEDTLTYFYPPRYGSGMDGHLRALAMGFGALAYILPNTPRGDEIRRMTYMKPVEWDNRAKAEA